MPTPGLGSCGLREGNLGVLTGTHSLVSFLFLLGPPKPPPELEPEPELEGLLTPVLEAGDADEGAVTRPLSPTRLQPALPPEAQSVPELEEVARVLAEIPRPLKRRGSMEQSPAVALPPTHKKQYQQIISRLFHRHSGPGGPEPELSSISEGSEARAGPPAPAPPAPIPPPALPQISPPEQLQSMVSNTQGHPGIVVRAWKCPFPFRTKPGNCTHHIFHLVRNPAAREAGKCSLKGLPVF